MKHLIAIWALILWSVIGHSQELNCNISILTPQLQSADPRLFEVLELAAEEFMNDRKWTNDDFSLEERIEVSIQITIMEELSLTSFKGSIQVQSSRPVYNSDYKTPLFFANDNDFQITFLENTLIQFSLDQHRDNLSSVLAYYAYMILGMDYDSFSPKGGTAYYLKAQQIVNNAQNAGEAGWRSSEGQRNRFWLVENILNQTFAPLRDCVYTYHRRGFDLLFEDMETGRKNIADALIELRKIHQIKPSSYNMQLFFYPKVEELINLFAPTPVDEKTRVYNLLRLVDPGNIQGYERIMNG